MNLSLAEKAELFAVLRREAGLAAKAPIIAIPRRDVAPAPKATRALVRPHLDPARQIDLVRAHRRGSRAASNDLLRAYEPMLKAYGAAFRRQGADADEAEQAGRIALLKAADRHEEAKGSFAAYAWHYIYFAMLKSAKETAALGAESIDVPLFDDDSPRVERLSSPWGNPESILIALEECRS